MSLKKMSLRRNVVTPGKSINLNQYSCHRSFRRLISETFDSLDPQKPFRTIFNLNRRVGVGPDAASVTDVCFVGVGFFEFLLKFRKVFGDGLEDFRRNWVDFFFAGFVQLRLVQFEKLRRNIDKG